MATGHWYAELKHNRVPNLRTYHVRTSYQLDHQVYGMEDEVGYTLLQWACYMQKQHAIAGLLDAGSDPLKKDDQNNTLLHLLLFDMDGWRMPHCMEVINSLVERGCLYDAVNDNGWSSIRLAADGAKLDIMAAMLRSRSFEQKQEALTHGDMGSTVLDNLCRTMQANLNPGCCTWRARAKYQKNCQDAEQRFGNFMEALCGTRDFKNPIIEGEDIEQREALRAAVVDVLRNYEALDRAVSPTQVQHNPLHGR